MLDLQQAIVVEGRYDSAKLRQLVNAPVFETSGFGIMNDKKDILEETSIEDPVENDLSQAPTPVEEIALAPTSEETEAHKATSEAERKKTYKTGSKVAAFIFFFRI